MTPTARAELRRYCADAARTRKVREPWTFADWTDAAIAVIAFTGLVFIGGFSAAENLHDARAKACATHLPDGRRLMTLHLSKDGPERCTYEQGPTPAKWKRG